ncbi:hypothetical protein HanRHA438_Chr09g0414321 [Helianthus annuus]|uniref:Uncharacterized protein n=1 Tax=Helianthus annuus TaxID=4232 RepID=A0A9K3I8A3_HELAN|nr:hypothetical protein HanXRQr2_Chr09g0402411 [Helianthus annuus]KAJ0535713.1 hypothetical protein HanIR_Chr09g0433621 [Helianthus annuus]KAJ0889571.1 hypothetical protein HanRHA438_Chr09g0414321 [Helianthus annuus]
MARKEHQQQSSTILAREVEPKDAMIGQGGATHADILDWPQHMFGFQVVDKLQW